ncbi:hypothetical protein LEG80045_06950 [Legionella pneumophila]|nr:hypothetical protein LEG80045_06950 [Legionella pneumophila]
MECHDLVIQRFAFTYNKLTLVNIPALRFGFISSFIDLILNLTEANQDNKIPSSLIR